LVIRGWLKLPPVPSTFRFTGGEFFVLQYSLVAGRWWLKHLSPASASDELNAITAVAAANAVKAPHAAPRIARRMITVTSLGFVLSDGGSIHHLVDVVCVGDHEKVVCRRLRAAAGALMALPVPPPYPEKFQNPQVVVSTHNFST
jgi:hypothetical protein